MSMTSPQNRTSRRLVTGGIAVLAVAAAVVGSAALRSDAGADADGVAVRAGQPTRDGVPVTYAALTRKVDADPDGHAFWITVEDGEVVRIDEQYLP